MSEHKFTPGPWEVLHDGEDGPSVPLIVSYDDTNDGEEAWRVARVTPHCGEPPATDANAALIAASPDLLLVVERFVAMWQTRTLRSPHEPMLTEEHELLIRLAANAITKATGGNHV